MSTGSTYLRLEVISGKATGDTIVVEDELIIGRHADGPGRLSEDEEISRQHARISREATGDYAIEDLGSSNGTFVNGLRIQSPRLLSLGDSIEAGATTLVVRAIVRQEPAAAAPDTADRPVSEPRSAPTVFAQSPAVEQATSPPVQEPVPAAEPTVSAESAPPSVSSEEAASPSVSSAEAASPSVSSPVPPPVSESALSPSSAEPAGRTPPLVLTLEVDFDAREARIALGGNGETVSLVFEDGVWRASPAEPDPDG
ncbi:MAG: FHA domain-containing protein [Solirubrobacterales bacterium]